MSLESIKAMLPDFAKDIRINISTVTTPEGAPGLTETQIWAIALSCAMATKCEKLIELIRAHATGGGFLNESAIQACRSSATIMAMNNVYYRFIHLIEDEEFKAMRANLRMMIIGNPGIDKIDFELMSLAVSAINGCGMCMVAHKNTVLKHGVTREGVQSAIRISAVIHATAQALAIA